MLPYTKKIFVKKRLPILEEYEKIKAKKSNHFCKVKDLLSAHRVARKEFYKHYHQWIEAVVMSKPFYLFASVDNRAHYDRSKSSDEETATHQRCTK